MLYLKYARQLRAVWGLLMTEKWHGFAAYNRSKN